MTIKRGNGGYVAFTNIRDITGNTQTPTIAAWATDTEYEIDDVVTTGTSPNFKYWKCRLSHESDDTATTGNEPNVSNNNSATYWKEIVQGAVMALNSWSLNETTTTETFQVLDEENARTVSTTLAATGSLVYGVVDGDPVQAELVPGHSGKLVIYPAGLASGEPTIEMQVEITGLDRSGSAAIRQATVNFGVDGDVINATVS